MNNGKAKVEDSGNGIMVEVPSKKNWFVLIFGTFWLFGWAFGAIMVLGTLGIFSGATGVVGPLMFLVFWLCAWTAGGLFIMTTILWGYFGKEKLMASQGEVVFEKTVFNIGIKKRLNASSVTNFRIQHIDDSLFGGSRMAIYGLGPGRIKFDYGFKTYSFGLALDEAEAQYLVDLLNKKIVKQSGNPIS
jgi:hypothetical protein